MACGVSLSACACMYVHIPVCSVYICCAHACQYLLFSVVCTIGHCAADWQLPPGAPSSEQR